MNDSIAHRSMPGTYRNTYSCRQTVPNYDTVCAYISTKYLDSHHAEMKCSYPELLTVIDRDNQCLGAVGYRPPGNSFFLEQYLDYSAESTLTTLYNRSVSRSDIVEIGNFVATDGQAGFALMQGLWCHLREQGYQHILVVCTKQLKRRFKYLPFHHLANAERFRVPEGHHWGRYYDHSPEVLTGELQHYDQRFTRYIKRQDLIVRHISAPESV